MVGVTMSERSMEIRMPPMTAILQYLRAGTESGRWGWSLIRSLAARDEGAIIVNDDAQLLRQVVTTR